MNLTSEETLPYNKKQVIEQAKSSLEKTFVKQIKRLKIKEKNKIKATEDNKKQLDNKKLGNNELLLLKKQEIIKSICIKRFHKINELSKKIDYGNLKLIVKGERKKFKKKLLFYFLCDNIWSDNFLFYHKT